jgi:nicotinic acid mononucleotide adenylyltransferase
MYIGRQLYALGLPVDLGVIAGASLGHDIGKYGVLEEDMRRVPYLHYYYTEEWFKRFSMDKIGHIATNHSTWDLELENLPIESLILIYSDFRVKSKIENDTYIMHIFSLSDSFDVILNKLDNVDAIKENRYKKVYKKLKDFEDYIISLGVDTTLNSKLMKSHKKPFELMNKKEILDNIKYMAIEHNIYLMSKLTDSSSFNSIIEMARGETNWRKLRLYLQIFKEYSIYLTQEQKTITLHFLSDLLLHTGEDIRKEAAELIGRLIALFDEEYRKELPPSVKSFETKKSSEVLLDEFLNNLLFPDHKVADSQREWLYNLKNIIKSLFEVSHKSNYKKYFDVLNKYYSNYDSLSTVAQFYLSQTINYIPIKALDNNRLLKLYTYILKQLDSDSTEIRLSTLDIIYEILNATNNIMFIASIRNWIIANLQKSSIPADNYLKYIIGMKINISPNYQEILDSNYAENQNDTSEIFLENLKTATEWVKKKVNIDILYDQVVKNPKNKGLHTAMHLCNILKVSAIERIRNYSGKTLLNIFHLLSPEERNDVAVELLRALEMDSYQFAKFIPHYLGQLLLYLPPNELDEIINDFEDKIKTVSPQVVFLLLNTIVISIENYSKYMERFEEKKDNYYKRIDRLLGLLSIAMASYDKDIKNESLMILSSNLFESKSLTLDEKFNIFDRIGKKILTLLYTDKENDFLFYSNAASLNHIYRFISLYEFYHKDLIKIHKQKIAFFPGSFDPFSLGHKEIAIEIRDQGFQVYLAVDEFSWSKRTEPHIFRRNIINMSIANEKDIYLFPKDIPINISNPTDLYKLKELFPFDDVYIVVGSDVLINASAYKTESPILEFAHIIFDRKSSISKDDDEKKLEESIENIRANIIRLSLPPQYEDISSSQIRKNIDLNRDISKFIDPLAESYIYDYGLYLREPQYKTLLQSKTLEVNVARNLSEKLLNEIKEQFGGVINIKHLESLRNKLSYRILLVREANSHELLGFSTFYWIRQSILYDEFNNSSITEYIRQSVKGRIVLISGVCVKNNSDYLIETVLNETLSIAINRDYNYAIYNNSLTKVINHKIEKQLLLQGFSMTDFIYNDNPIFMVNMNNPMTLNLDLENMLKPPYSTDSKVLETIKNTRNRLKEALVNLYPGELLVTYNRDMTYSKLIQKICDTNQVSIIQSSKRNLGPNMCVPFGSILNSSIIPNTVTKTMHTEKVFKSNIIDFTIETYPHYLSLVEQAKVLKSFNRPVILVDDLLNKGYRINVIVPILRSMGIEIEKVILGILSGRGSEIGKEKNIPLDYAYFIPNLKLWFNESNQYPFIGGDMVDRNVLESTSIPSINMILPYVAPRFIKNTKNDSIYNLSEICLQNSLMIFQSIEEVYQSINEKSLNIKGLGEVLVSPRHPDTNKAMILNKNLKPSVCIDMDLEYLRRLENIIRR